MLAGYLVARAHLISSEGVAGFTNVTFYLFVPALLFRAMRGIHFETLDLKPLYTYFGGALICFFLVLAVSRRWLGRSTRHATVTAPPGRCRSRNRRLDAFSLPGALSAEGRTDSAG